MFICHSKGIYVPHKRAYLWQCSGKRLLYTLLLNILMIYLQLNIIFKWKPDTFFSKAYVIVYNTFTLHVFLIKCNNVLIIYNYLKYINSHSEINYWWLIINRFWLERIYYKKHSNSEMRKFEDHLTSMKFIEKVPTQAVIINLSTILWKSWHDTKWF